MLYLDTSALLKLYILEEGSEWVQQHVTSQEDPLPIWELQHMEFTNALRLKVFWKDITAKQAEHQLELFTSRKKRGLYVFPQLDRSALQDRFQSLATHTMKLGCRTLDVLHVACACELAAGHFLSFDQRQQTLARKAGLNVPAYPPAS
jgi:predicted nucleic acid-binding protein